MYFSMFMVFINHKQVESMTMRIGHFIRTFMCHTVALFNILMRETGNQNDGDAERQYGQV